MDLPINLVKYPFCHWRASTEAPISYLRRALGAEGECQAIKVRWTVVGLSGKSILANSNLI